MNEYDKFKKVKINNQNSSFNIIDSLNKSKFEQLKEISQKTKLKLNNKFYLDKTPPHIKSDFQPKRAHNKLKNYITNSKTDYSNYNKVPHKTKKNVIILLIPNKIKLKYILKEQVKLTVIIIF